MEEFILKFSDILDDIDSSNLNENTNFRNLEYWDSITGLSVIGMIDEEYGVTFNADDMKACTTIGDLYNRIKEKK